uniref:Uncharacterized protein n=1 Tax=Anguilla anguilla TaxID=7936 RepID=A0A0E9VMK2_ANGAN
MCNSKSKDKVSTTLDNACYRHGQVTVTE